MQRFSASCVTVVLFALMFSCSAGPRAEDGDAGAVRQGLSLASPRKLLPFVTLEDGRVLAAGGHDGHRTLSSCEVFEPATGRWGETGALRTRRRNYAAVRLKDGGVLVMGGSNGVALGALSEVEVYSPATGTWREVARMAVARNDPAAVLLADGRVLVAGGTDVDQRPLRSAEVFDPETGTWGFVAPPGFVRGGAQTAVLLDTGKVLFVSGLQSELYDPVTGLWEKAGLAGGAAGTHRLAHSVTLLPDGRVLVVGGTTARAASTAEVYSPQTGTWTLVSAPQVPREHHATVVLPDGAVLVMGGEHYTTGALASVERFDPRTETWSSEPALEEPREKLGALALVDGAVLVMGGGNEAMGMLVEAERYVPGTCGVGPCSAPQPASAQGVAVLPVSGLGE